MSASCFWWIVAGLLLFSACGKDIPVDEEKEKQEQKEPDKEKEEEKEEETEKEPDKEEEKEEPAAEPVLQEIEIAQLPSRNTYLVYSAEELDLSGLVVEGIYDNGERKVLDIGPDAVSGFSTALLVEELPVTVSYEGKEAVFTVKISDAIVEEGVLKGIVDTGKSVFTVPQGVKTIGASVFFGSRIEQVVLTEGVESVGEMAFANSQIRQVDFPKSLKTIGAGAFMGCQNLEIADLKHTEVSVISDRTFADCGIRKVVLPVSLRQIGTKAFMRTGALQELALPEGLTSVAMEAFRQSGITSAVLPNGVKTLGKRAFYHCESLKTVRCSGTDGGVADGEIQSEVFVGCLALSELTLPASVSSVGRTLFSGGTSLERLVMQGNVASMAFNALGNTSVATLVVMAPVPPSVDTYSLPKQAGQISVPQASLEQYKSAGGWDKYRDKISGM